MSRPVFVIDKNATSLFVPVAYTGIPRVSLFCTREVPIGWFGKGSALFVRVRDVLSWHEANPDLGVKKYLPDLRRTLERFDNGTLVVEEFE
jgi:hypothetical protein